MDDAITMIKEAGLGDGMIKYVDSDLPEGTVTFQSIDAETEVKAGTVINLQASKGPEEAQEPAHPHALAGRGGGAGRKTYPAGEG